LLYFIYLGNTVGLKPNTAIDLGEANWERWRKQAKEFLLGAEYYLSVKAYSAALFSLHQCTEDVLIAIIRSVLGYKINSHNLLRLLRVTQFFTNDLTSVFQIDTDQGKKNFTVLKDAYINVRYRDTYSPDSSSLDILYPVVTSLLSTAEEVHTQFLLRNSI
jgi:HEPN domain-containing protein